MPQSLSAVYLHIVFSTKGRTPLIRDDFRDELHAYIGGIAKNLGCQPLGVGGTDDHVHILARLSKTVTIAALIRDLKSNSSAWAKGRVPQFAWQSGYGAFSFGPEALATEQRYVAHQAEHHSRESFQDEVRRLLRASGVEWDEGYLWDWCRPCRAPSLRDAQNQG
jgi:putative transposase